MEQHDIWGKDFELGVEELYARQAQEARAKLTKNERIDLYLSEVEEWGIDIADENLEEDGLEIRMDINIKEG